jgi:hypothetical protein
MLPWLVAVLLALNLGLFWWGQRYEVPIDPELPPLPAASYPIVLVDRAEQGTGTEGGEPLAPGDLPEAPSVKGDAVAGTSEGATLLDLQSQAQPAPAVSDPLLGAGADAGTASMDRPIGNTAPAPTAASGETVAAEADSGLATDALVAAAAAGVAGAATADVAKPKVAKKRKVKRRRSVKPVDPFLDLQ